MVDILEVIKVLDQAHALGLHELDKVRHPMLVEQVMVMSELVSLRVVDMVLDNTLDNHMGVVVQALAP